MVDNVLFYFTLSISFYYSGSDFECKEIALNLTKVFFAMVDIFIPPEQVRIFVLDDEAVTVKRIVHALCHSNPHRHCHRGILWQSVNHPGTARVRIPSRLMI